MHQILLHLEMYDATPAWVLAKVEAKANRIALEVRHKHGMCLVLVDKNLCREEKEVFSSF
jgi:hypothetical protein